MNLSPPPRRALIVYFIGTPRVNRDGREERGPRPMEHRKGGNYMGATRRTSNHAIVIHPFRQRRGRRVGKGQMRIARGPLFYTASFGIVFTRPILERSTRPDPIRSAARIIGHDVKQIARPIAFPPYSCQRPFSRENLVIFFQVDRRHDCFIRCLYCRQRLLPRGNVSLSILILTEIYTRVQRGLRKRKNDNTNEKKSKIIRIVFQCTINLYIFPRQILLAT